jgi:hypothetical protein
VLCRTRIRGKGCMRDREVLLLPAVMISSFLYDLCVLYRFLSFPPAFINLRMKFLLRGEGYNSPCYGLPNHLCYSLIQESNTLINPIQSSPRSKFKPKFRSKSINSKIWNSKLLFMSDLSSKCKQELLLRISSIFENFKKKSYQSILNFKP